MVKAASTIATKARLAEAVRGDVANRSATGSAVAGIEARDVTVTYSNGHTALRDASFSIPNATICALVGVNGSGKSTLFKAIMGFVPLASGKVDILGKPAGRALKRNTVAYVPQNEDVDWDFPVLVEDVVMMGRYGHMNFLRRPSKKDREHVESALERVNMLDFRDRQIGQLSGGQKKRVFLARALAQESRIILLDEPFTGVDVKTEESIIALMRSMRDEGRVMLVSTHNLGSVPQFCDHVVLINRTLVKSRLLPMMNVLLYFMVKTNKESDSHYRQMILIRTQTIPGQGKPSAKPAGAFCLRLHD